MKRSLSMVASLRSYIKVFRAPVISNERILPKNPRLDKAELVTPSITQSLRGALIGRQCLAELFAGIMQAIPSIPSL